MIERFANMLTIFAKKKSILDVRLGSAYAPEENFGQLIWVKVFKNGLSKICIRQPLKNADHGLPKQSVFHKFHLVHS